MTNQRRGRPPGRTKTTAHITIDIDLLARARESGINISASAEAGVRAKLLEKLAKGDGK